MSRRSVLAGLAVGVVAFMTVAGLALAVILAARGDTGVLAGNRLALIEIDGLITGDGEVLEQIRRFRRDASVKGFVVAINSPGGVVGPSQSLFRELRRIREAGVPVVASIGAVGASGGYYVALAADSIFALPGSITGSIGVIMQFPDASGLMERVGVRWDVVQSAEHKDLGSPFRPLSPGDREVLATLVDDVYDQFVDEVAAERRLSREAVAGLADGRILSGRQALEAGLIDAIGNLHDALSAAGRMSGLGDEPRFVRPPRRGIRLLDLLLGQGTTSALGDVVRPFDRAGGFGLKYVVPWQ